MGLFRQEVQLHQGQKLFGQLSLAQPLKLSLLFYCLLLILIISAFFITHTSYTQKETVMGQIEASAGVSNYYASSSKTVVEVFVKNGDVVEKEQPLLRLKNLDSDRNGQLTAEQDVRQIERQLSLINSQKQLAKQKFETQSQRLYEQQVQTAQRLASQQRLGQLIDSQLEIVKQQFVASEHLAAQNIISNNSLQLSQTKLLDVQERKSRHQIEIERIRSAMAQITLDKAELVSATKIEQHKYQQSIEELNVRLTRYQQVNEQIVFASNSGVVTSMSVKTGQPLNQGQFLMTIAPSNSRFLAKLFVPSRAIGFVTTKTQVHLKLSAFPYEKFGFIKATLTTIPIAPVTLNGQNSRTTTNNTFYQIEAQLSQQQIESEGIRYPLTQGMLLTADIQLESRTLAGWFFAPILTALGA